MVASRCLNRCVQTCCLAWKILSYLNMIFPVATLALGQGFLSARAPKAWLEFMMSHELQLESVGESEPRRNFLVVLSATIFGSFVPLVPYFLVGKDLLLCALGSVTVSGVALFVIGYYEARTTVGSLWRSGLQMAAIGLAAGLAGFLIGHFIGASPA